MMFFGIMIFSFLSNSCAQFVLFAARKQIEIIENGRKLQLP